MTDHQSRLDGSLDSYVICSPGEGAKVQGKKHVFLLVFFLTKTKITPPSCVVHHIEIVMTWSKLSRSGLNNRIRILDVPVISCSNFGSEYHP